MEHEREIEVDVDQNLNSGSANERLDSPESKEIDLENDSQSDVEFETRPCDSFSSDNEGSESLFDSDND